MPSHATAADSDRAHQATAHLPDDPALLKTLLVELLQALHVSQRQSAPLQARLDALLRRLYGPRAERFNPLQPWLFPELADTPPAATTPAAAAVPEAVTPAAAPRPHAGHGRQRLPEHWIRRRQVHDLTAAERLCACCGQPRALLGEDVSEQLEYEPASLYVIEHVRRRYACLDCAKQRAAAAANPAAAANAAAANPAAAANATAANPAEPATTLSSPAVAGSSPAPSPTPTPAVAAATRPPAASAPAPVGAPAGAATPAPARTAAATFVTAPKPAQPIPGGLPGPGLLAHLIVSKYGDHLPLYRLEQIFARQGVPLARQTLCGWLPVCAALLRPLYDLMCERLWQCWVIGSADTTVAVLRPGRGQTQTGRVWVYVGDVFAPYHIYDYTPTREQQGPQGFLHKYLGYFQADAYAGYEALYACGRLVEVACWAHARRKFYEARATDPERALYVLGVIRQLYAVERQADEESAARQLGREEGWWLRLRLRQEQSVALLTGLCQWLEQERARVLPKSPIGEAIT